MAGIFISYRRDDSAGWTGRLSTDLQERFGQETVFQDIGAIGAGEDFIDAIERSLESCSAVLVLIGPEWSLVKDKAGTRRLDNPEDTVRLEVARALARKDRLVIPVLVGGAKMPTADELPPELKALARRNAFELSDTRWNYDLEQLVASLIKRAGLPPTAPPVSPGRKPTRWLIAFSSGIVVLVGLLASYSYFMTQETSTRPPERDSQNVMAVAPKELNLAGLADLKQRVSRLQQEFFPLLQSDLDRAEANQIADHFREAEKNIMIEKGVKTGMYTLNNVEMYEKNLSGKNFFVMSYTASTETQSQSAWLYLFFPKESNNDWFILAHYSVSAPENQQVATREADFLNADFHEIDNRQN